MLLIYMLTHAHKDNDGILDEFESAQFNVMIVEKINRMRTALLVVDFQNDFIDGELGLKARDCGNFDWSIL